MPLIEYKDRHELPDEDAVAIFDHVGYTGGATLSAALIKHYDGGHVSAPSGRMIHVDYADMAHQARDLRFVYGHCARGAHIFFPEGKKTFYFTLLRHPLRVWLSRYTKAVLKKHSGKNPEFLNEILNSYVHASPANYFVDWYGNGDILLAEQRVFGQYAFFGITEFLGESIYALAEIFPCLKQEKVIYNKLFAPKHGMAISKIAEECFYEKKYQGYGII